jgi:hypothetical protein
MVEYELPGVNMHPIKKNPYKPSTTEWAYLSSFTNNLEPSNLSCRMIVRGPNWINSNWTDCRKYLHQMFINYNRSGQHGDDKDEWGSDKELRHWCRALFGLRRKFFYAQIFEIRYHKIILANFVIHSSNTQFKILKIQIMQCKREIT